MFSWTETDYKIRFSVTILQMLIFTCRLLDPCPTSIALFSRSRLFSHHFKHSPWCLTHLSTKPLATLVSSDIQTVKGGYLAPSKLFLLLLSTPRPSYSYREKASHQRGKKNLLDSFCKANVYTLIRSVNNRIWNMCSVMFKMDKREVTFPWSEAHTISREGGVTLLCLKSPNRRASAQEIKQH